jgi:uncharacterized protein YcbX
VNDAPGDARVTRISIAPVKGLALQQVSEVELGANGVTGNRRLHLVAADGRLVNGKSAMRLSLVASRLDCAARTLALEFPGGKVVSGALELGEPFETVFYGRPAGGRIVVGPWAAALSAFSEIELRLIMSNQVGAASDRGPGAGVSLISSASIADLARAGGVEKLDPGRFRMLFEIDGVGAYTEETWIDRDVRIGDAVVHPLGNIGRCVVTTCDPATGERDFDTLGVLASYRRGVETTEPLPLGVVGGVVQTGRVRVGDPVIPL